MCLHLLLHHITVELYLLEPMYIPRDYTAGNNYEVSDWQRARRTYKPRPTTIHKPYELHSMKSITL